MKSESLHLVLKPGKERSVLRRHPWIYSGAVRHLPKAPAGTIVEVRDAENGILGHGFLTSGHSLVCLMFSFGQNREPFDQAFWQNRLADAWRLRQDLLLGQETSGFRLIHAEGDQIPGLILDVYADTAVVEVRNPGLQLLREPIVTFLKERGIQHIYRRTEQPDTGEWWLGKTPSAEFLEHGLRYHADIEKGQKTGFFLDQRDNRFLLRRYSAGRQVLNAFSYTAGFSVNALAGGAASVVSLDSSARAIEVGNANVALNFPGDPRHSSLTEDCFAYLKEMPEEYYDLIVLDPPAFTKHPKTVEKAARGYKEINLKAMRKIRSGGILFTFSCSQHMDKKLFRQVAFAAAVDSGRSIRVLHELGQAPDHPVSIFHPEGDYLKGLVLEVE